jgi:hypothetical protein
VPSLIGCSPSTRRLLESLERVVRLTLDQDQIQRELAAMEFPADLRFGFVVLVIFALLGMVLPMILMATPAGGCVPSLASRGRYWLPFGASGVGSLPRFCNRRSGRQRAVGVAAWVLRQVGKAGPTEPAAALKLDRTRRTLSLPGTIKLLRATTPEARRAYVSLFWRRRKRSAAHALRPPLASSIGGSILGG